MAADTDELPDDEQIKHDNALLQKHVDQLMEHFSSVCILATRHRADSENTALCSRGRGDWYAQYGAAREWIIVQEQRTKQHVKGEGSE